VPDLVRSLDPDHGWTYSNEHGTRTEDSPTQVVRFISVS